jgi:hypothetical protein
VKRGEKNLHINSVEGKKEGKRTGKEGSQTAVQCSAEDMARLMGSLGTKVMGTPSCCLAWLSTSTVLHRCLEAPMGSLTWGKCSAGSRG